jgi:hypothetical protein
VAATLSRFKHHAAPYDESGWCGKSYARRPSASCGAGAVDIWPGAGPSRRFDRTEGGLAYQLAKRPGRGIFRRLMTGLGLAVRVVEK